MVIFFRLGVGIVRKFQKNCPQGTKEYHCALQKTAPAAMSQEKSRSGLGDFRRKSLIYCDFWSGPYATAKE
jgi:hypothetical protein